MIGLNGQALIDSTTASGSMLVRQIKKPVVIGAMIAVLATSAAYGSSEERSGRPHDDEHTTAGASSTAPVSTAIGELRRLSGLNWDQLAKLFDVSRRALHFWASGRAMTPRHEEHLHRLLAIVRKNDRGSAAANRTALLAAGPDGHLPTDLLGRKEYEGALALLGSSGGHHRKLPQRVSAEARAARRPLPPEELVDALQEGGPPTSGPLLSASALKIPRSK